MTKHCRNHLVLSVCVGVLALVFGVGQMEEKEEKPAPYEKLASHTAEERMKLLEQLSSERAQMEIKLISQLEEGDTDVKLAAAYLLGRYRCGDASPRFLAKHIALFNEESKGAVIRIPLYGAYPVKEALIKIGPPSIPAMLRNIETSEDKQVRQFSAEVIYRIMQRTGPDFAKIILARSMEGKPDAVQANYKEAIEIIETLQAPKTPTSAPASDRLIPRLLPRGTVAWAGSPCDSRAGRPCYDLLVSQRRDRI